MAARRKSTAAIYTLRIELQYIEPLIWRRVHVATDIPLPRLHDLLQIVMGWTDSHLHSFRIGDRGYTNAEDCRRPRHASGERADARDAPR